MEAIFARLLSDTYEQHHEVIDEIAQQAVERCIVNGETEEQVMQWMEGEVRRRMAEVSYP